MNWKLQRSAHYETLESRLVMSGQALTDYVADLRIEAPQVDVDQYIETLMHSSGSNSDAFNNLEAIREQYNLDGKGQTIAVIDSGIAFDHIAFGGGFGAGHRVVGGYDFAENDGNPYDDGPLGLHGTHISGIIGGSSDEYSGIAPGADLVSLRVFDDNGAGNLAWVEQALQWVHDNRTAFENPITTVNISIGMTWNADTIPEAAQLEDEFAQLEADGIFVSVAAGNLFESYNSPGVSYPAASPFVVPVASYGEDGLLSDFSQRNDRVLVAPGENILSTVPDYVFQGSNTNGYLRTTGTSQAAPFVAGASALLREAFQNAGQENVDQDLLYQHFRETADVIYDQATGGYYHRINMHRAIEVALAETQGDSNSSPGETGQSNTNMPVSLNNGVLTIKGTGGDDQVQFHQGASIDVGLNDVSYQFQSNQVNEIVVIGRGGNDSITATFDADLEASVLRVSRVDVTGPQVDFTARGFESIDVIANGSTGLLSIRDSAGNDVVNANFDTVAISGDGFSHSATGFNRVAIIGTDGHDQVAFTGSSGDDRFISEDGRNVLRQGENRIVARSFEHISVIASAGHDIATVRDSSGNDDFELNGQGFFVEADGYRIWGGNFERINAEATNGYDRIKLVGGNISDDLVHSSSSTRLQSDLYLNKVVGFDVISVFANGGNDTAQVYGSAGNDQFFAQGDQTNFSSANKALFTNGFETVNVYSGPGGFDLATLVGSVGSDQVNATANSTSMTNVAGIRTTVNQFDSVQVDTLGGYDLTHLVGSSQRDVLRSIEQGLDFESTMQMLRIVNAESHQFDGNGGVDEAIFADFDSLDLLSAIRDGATAYLGGQQFDVEDIEFLEARTRMGESAFYDFDAVDFLFLLNGNWNETSG